MTRIELQKSDRSYPFCFSFSLVVFFVVDPRLLFCYLIFFFRCGLLPGVLPILPGILWLLVRLLQHIWTPIRPPVVRSPYCFDFLFLDITFPSYFPYDVHTSQHLAPTSRVMSYRPEFKLPWFLPYQDRLWLAVLLGVSNLEPKREKNTIITGVLKSKVVK